MELKDLEYAIKEAESYATQGNLDYTILKDISHDWNVNVQDVARAVDYELQDGE